MSETTEPYIHSVDARMLAYRVTAPMLQLTELIKAHDGSGREGVWSGVFQSAQEQGMTVRVFDNVPKGREALLEHLDYPGKTFEAKIKAIVGKRVIDHSSIFMILTADNDALSHLIVLDVEAAVKPPLDETLPIL